MPVLGTPEQDWDPLAVFRLDKGLLSSQEPGSKEKNEKENSRSVESTCALLANLRSSKSQLASHFS